MASPQNNEDELAIPDETPLNGARRSGRAKKAPTKYDEEYIIPNETPSRPQPVVKQNRPKRKAAETAAQAIVPEDVGPLLEQILARVNPEERKEYGGWVELESEPAFFNVMLQELGAKDLKVQEVFGLDEMMLEDLSKPVHGLIFLYQYTNADESSESRQDCPENLWFGNQTTANACATVALMNIIMNAKDATLGPELAKFKDSTKSLPPPHRGYMLDKSDFIRGVHNLVARRSDLVSEDLLLDNKFEDAEKRKKLAGTSKRKPASRPARKKVDRDTSYHYIAYVPVDGQVWELDGFEAKPLCLGPYANSPSWLSVASEAVQTRMMRDEFLSFNLLAICQSPLLTISNTLATNLICAQVLDDLYSGNPTWAIPSPRKLFPADRLARFNLSRDDVTPDTTPDPNPNSGNNSTRQPPPSFTAKTSAPDFDAAAAQTLAQELRAEQESLEAAYVAELADVDQALETIRGRQRDYTPAVHQWVRTLAEKGVLRELIQEMDQQRQFLY